MAGRTRRHAVLKSRISARLTIALGERAPCRVDDSDTRVVVERGANLNAYHPDMILICNEAQTHPRAPDGGVVNPRLIGEVTSPNTEKRDRGVKLDDYRLIPSLSEYVIAPWARRLVTAGQSVELGLGVALDVDDLYRDPLPPR